MRKSKIQSLIPFIFRRFQILQLFVLCHGVPASITLFIAVNVVELRAGIYSKIDEGEEEKILVAASEVRCIVCSKLC